jgi:hypothetical protein
MWSRERFTYMMALLTTMSGWKTFWWRIFFVLSWCLFLRHSAGHLPPDHSSYSNGQ